MFYSYQIHIPIKNRISLDMSRTFIGYSQVIPMFAGSNLIASGYLTVCELEAIA